MSLLPQAIVRWLDNEWASHIYSYLLLKTVWHSGHSKFLDPEVPWPIVVSTMTYGGRKHGTTNASFYAVLDFPVVGVG